MTTHYICTGSCCGWLDAKDYKPGQTCAAETCEKHKQPLVKREYCEKCKAHYLPGEKHACK